MSEPFSALGFGTCMTHALSLTSAPYAIAQGIATFSVNRNQEILYNPRAAKEQAYEEAHLAINICTASAGCVYTGH